MIGKAKRFVRGRMMRYISPENMLFLIHLKQAWQGDDFPFQRAVLLEAELPAARVLVLAPHPDDEVLGAGGSLLRYRAAGAEIRVLYLTDGAGADGGVERELMARTRQAEARAVADGIGFQPVFLGRRDGGLCADEETIAALGNQLADFRPQRIYAPSFLDSHPDHQAANRILQAALHRGRGSDAEIFGYEVWTNLPFPNHAVDISDGFAAKLGHIAHYRSQLQIFDYQGLLQARNRLNHLLYVDTGSAGYAEAFLRFSAAAYLHAASLPTRGRRRPG